GFRSQLRQARQQGGKVGDSVFTFDFVAHGRNREQVTGRSATRPLIVWLTVLSAPLSPASCVLVQRELKLWHDRFSDESSFSQLLREASRCAAKKYRWPLLCPISSPWRSLAVVCVPAA